MTYRKKLIEVALLLEAINMESVRERVDSAWVPEGAATVGGVSGSVVVVAGG